MNTQRRTLGNWIENPDLKIIPRGNAALLYAIQAASQLLASKPDTLCIIGCVDSLLRDTTLDWFESENRLKSTSYGRQHGLIASEAVCYLIVEERQRAIRAKRPILARIASLGLQEEPHPRASGECGIYTGLAGACQTALKPFKGRELKAIFGNLNGEDDRAREWSIAALRSFKKNDAQPDAGKPAEFYGDVGAASGAVMAAIVSQGFARNWLQSPVMIFCADDHGSCGAVILEKE